MGKYIDDPFEEHERDAYRPYEGRGYVAAQHIEPELGSELSGPDALRAIRETRAKLVTERMTA